MRTSFGNRLEKGILAGVIILAEYHFLWLAFYYFLGEEPYKKIGYWIGTVLLAAVVFCFLYRMFREQGSTGRIRDIVKNCPFEQLFLFAWLLWFIAGCFLREWKSGEKIFAGNDHSLFILVLMCFVFFPLPAMLGPKKAARINAVMLHTLAIPFSIYTVWALWQYFHMNYVTFPSGHKLEMTEGFALKLGWNQNYAAAAATAMLAVCLILLFTTRSRFRLFYIFAAAAQMAVILLTNSRASFVGSLIMLMATAFLAVWALLKKRKVTVRIACGFAAALICGLIYIWMRGEIFVLLNAFTHCMEQPQAVARDMDGLSGRQKIWKAAIKLMLSSPFRFLFGVTPYKLPDLMLSMGIYKKRRFIQAHNVLLTLGASYGVPVMAGYVLFLVSMCRRSLRVLFSKRRYSISNAWVFPAAILGLLAIDMMESFLAVRHEISTPLFYYFCGMIVMADRTAENEKGESLNE